ncbi:DUF1524 domain-containing protein [Kocuria palustris]|uniref:GmrSD restriction endonuclease domain-containing protein n=1 Tax=Kocuria palustris TaxID=71999 RepID=UPI0021B45972|nr:DUF1524 domain-containing protein [Kocuria palustris]
MTPPDDEADVTPARPRSRSSATIGCLGCGGCLVLAVLALAVMVVIGLLVGPQPEDTAGGEPTTSAPASPAEEPAAGEPSAEDASLAPQAEEEDPEQESSGPAASEQRSEHSPAPIEDSSASDAASALAVLDTLEVKGRAPKTGYGRDRFGPTWEDVDGNGCSTRNDILARDLTDLEREDGCAVTSGLLQDPYTGTAIDFTAGVDTSADVQIDHVVALSDAWQKGAQQMSEQQRLVFANDPLNLLAVDGPTNQSKGDADAATWLPPNRDYRCPYVARQVEVKSKYDLWVTQPEHDRIEDVLQDCDDQPASETSADPAAPPADGVPDPAPEPAPEPDPAPAPEPDAPAQSFGSCAEARAAGAAPLHRGLPGYSPRLDRDGDGVACE